jgi:hypothetical protein
MVLTTPPVKRPYSAEIAPVRIVVSSMASARVLVHHHAVHEHQIVVARPAGDEELAVRKRVAVHARRELRGGELIALHRKAVDGLKAERSRDLRVVDRGGGVRVNRDDVRRGLRQIGVGARGLREVERRLPGDGREPVMRDLDRVPPGRQCGEVIGAGRAGERRPQALQRGRGHDHARAVKRPAVRGHHPGERRRRLGRCRGRTQQEQRNDSRTYVHESLSRSGWMDVWRA